MLITVSTVKIYQPERLNASPKSQNTMKITLRAIDLLLKDIDDDC